MTEPLTPLERRVYHYLIDFLAENTYQPSIREIAKKFRIKSTKTVSDLLASLSQKGFIERDQSRSRGVRIVGFSGTANTQPVPYYGKVHAGEPALIPEHRKSFITMDRRFLPSDDVFFLRIKGESMIGRGIFEGDYVMVSPSTRAKDGDIVAARLGDEATVKTLTHRGATIVLEPANDAERSIEVGPRDDFAVLGVVCGVFRPFMEEREQPTLNLAPDSEVHGAATRLASPPPDFVSGSRRPTARSRAPRSAAAASRGARAPCARGCASPRS